MAVLKYKDPNGEWIEVGLSQQSITPEGIGAIPAPEDVQEGQILTYNGESWEAADAPESGVTSVNEKTGAITLTKSDVGLGNLDNIKQYSASNEPPYPVTKVNNKTGDIILTANDISGVAKLSTKVDITLEASKWSNSQYIITNTAITATSIIEGLPLSTITKEQLEAFGNALVIGGTQSDGSLTLKALGEVPTINIPITLVIRGDM